MPKIISMIIRFAMEIASGFFNCFPVISKSIRPFININIIAIEALININSDIIFGTPCVFNLLPKVPPFLGITYIVSFI